MTRDLCISLRFIQPFPLFHGRRDSGEPEWPPSPLRAFQSLLNAAGLQARGRPLSAEVSRALRALEGLQPNVVAPRANLCIVGHRAYVPHNQTDLVASAWHRGNLDASLASHRMEKDFRPMRIEAATDELPAVHYIYPIDPATFDPENLVRTIRPSVRAITHLGWGIDQVIADASLIDPSAPPFTGERWLPSQRGGRRLRVTRKGTLDALERRHVQILNRLQGGWTPVVPLSAFDLVHYRRETDPLQRPFAVFKLIDDIDGDPVACPHARLKEIAGMVRHVAIERMKERDAAPRDLRGYSPDEWVEQYVAGHMPRDDRPGQRPHAQFSYVPLPSIGHAHTDPAVRRVMLVAPVGDDDWLEHLAVRLDGQRLEALPGTRLPAETRLERVVARQRDGVRDAYIALSRTWASFTPVILPGHDDHKPEKTKKLILKALAQSGIDQPCEFEWSAFSRFSKSYSANKYVRDEQFPDGKRHIGYHLPERLRDHTVVHMQLRFDHAMPGPITIGAGRHCGFGLFASLNEAEGDRERPARKNR